MPRQFALPLILILSTCSSAWAQTAAKPSCPATQFTQFAQAFADNEQVQRSFVNTPLVSHYMDVDAQPEPKVVSRKLALAEIKFPLLPAKAEREARKLKLKIDADAENEAWLIMEQPDTDYQMRYQFVRKNDCWTLMKMDDASL